MDDRSPSRLSGKASPVNALDVLPSSLSAGSARSDSLAAAYGVDVPGLREIADWVLTDDGAVVGPEIEETGPLTAQLREGLVAVLALLDVQNLPTPPPGLATLISLARRTVQLQGADDMVGPLATIREDDVQDVPLGPVKRMRQLARMIQLLMGWAPDTIPCNDAVSQAECALEQLSPVGATQPLFDDRELWLCLLRTWKPGICGRGCDGLVTSMVTLRDEAGRPYSSYLCVMHVREHFDHQRSAAQLQKQPYLPQLPVDSDAPEAQQRLTQVLSLPRGISGLEITDA